MTSILALIVLLTALPMTGITAQAAGKYYTAINSKTRAESDGTVTKAPGTRFNIYYYVLDDNGGSEVAYCLNKGKTQPTTDVDGDGWFVRERVTRSNLSEYIKNASDKAYNDLISVTFNGYPKNGNNLPEVSGVSNALYRVVTQYAIWTITDGSSAQSAAYFLPYVGVDINSERGKELINHWDTMDELTLSPEEEACIEEAKAAIKLYDALLAWKPADDSFYLDHDLFSYHCSIDGAKDLQRLITVDCLEKAREGIEFSKTDIVDGEELKGAELTVSGVDNLGQKVEIMWTSTGSARKFKLRAGEYTLTEDQAPLGYKIAESIDFRITEDLKLEIKDGEDWKAPHSAKTVRMEDKRTSTPVVFSKVAAGQGNELSGAELRVVVGEGENGEIAKDADGKELKWTSDGKTKEFELAWGTYTMVEDQAPLGYKVATSITFKIEKDKSIWIKKGEDWESAENATIQMIDELAPEKPKTEEPKKEEPKKEEPKNEEPKNETPSDNGGGNTPNKPAEDSATVLGAVRTEESVAQTAETVQTQVLGARRSPETADPTPLTTLVVLAGASLVGILTLLLVWHDANAGIKKKRR